MDAAERQLIEQVTQGSEQAFERFYKTWFKCLNAYAFTMLRDEVMAEEAVQEVFFKIWERREQLNIHTSARAFLYRSVYHQCLNVLKQQLRRDSHRDDLLNHESVSADDASVRLELREFQLRLQAALSQLPEQCRTIFYMSRFDELKYREIAAQLGISIKTVEAQMGKALKIMREKLADLLPLLIWILYKMN